MAKIHPHLLSTSPSFSTSEATASFTVWMKSLVFSSNGCTIFDASGEIVYRIDNYDTKCSSHVYVMDLKGKVLSTLIRKKLRLNEHWNGYKNERVKNEKPWFKVKKMTKIFNKKDGFSCQVIIDQGEEKSQAFSCFTIQGCSQKSEFKIIRGDGLVVAQVKRKQSKGVMLGDDVLSLDVEPSMDNSFIVSLVVVHGLMSHKI